MLFHPSGGLVYHWRAWRHGRTGWGAYTETVAGWLDDWQPTPRHLVLVGPSAGYSLTPAFLARFDTVTALEPDPLARFLLARRFAGNTIAFAPGLADFGHLPRHFPGAAYLFCNLLGQTIDLTTRPGWQSSLEQAMAGQAWASYHDLLSTSVPPSTLARCHTPPDTPLEVIAGHYWSEQSLAAVDHGTHGLRPDLPRQHVIWPLQPGQYHLVEWLHE